MKNTYKYILPALALALVSCEPSFDNEVDNSSYSKGEADFSTYVAIGNSLTAGYMDGTVFKSSQENSFPNILSKQFAIVGGGVFTQPSYADDTNNLGGLTLGGVPLTGTRLIINMDTGGPENLKGVPTIEVGKLQAKAYNNMGVPGAKSFHLLAPNYGNVNGVITKTANPYFVRHATSPSVTVLEDAMSLNPTFFTNWIGNNDVLGYSTSGGVGAVGGTGENDITPVAFFQQAYEKIIETLTSKGAKGVVATIPDVTAIPYFTTVPYNPVPLQADNVAKLNAAFAQYNGGLKQALGAGLIKQAEVDSRTINFVVGNNAVVIVDKFLTDLKGLGLPSYRHATKEDLLTLPSRTIIGTVVGGDVNMINGLSVPLADQWVLTKDEVAIARQATTDFNNIIKATASSKGLAIVDMNAVLNKAVSGLRAEDGQIYTADYFKGLGNLSTVMFSLDGVHLNARGYAFVSNEILKVINSHYKAKLPMVNPATYPGPTLLPSNK
ncbi:G-D-S-L family lipolytic protein [Flavobacterium sp. HSC-61S13]|uniref:G-D-S-L family lipolytic protein n=1 Tax=Flavobacterium sp. HSC-61S13 TaxID=2910963 RepID=UPI00209E425C|nr:G-D-S-L family lipolytic protein [Flavobacterium sp. HSC-61S13]MCP1997538.1 lysophospholipase L1-like esterase [Flavobacterium sp. HSC-61S13]